MLLVIGAASLSPGEVCELERMELRPSPMAVRGGRSPWDRRCQCTEALLVSGAASLFAGEGPAIRSTKKMNRLVGHNI